MVVFLDSQHSYRIMDVTRASSSVKFPAFISNDSHYKKQKCWCGCPPSKDADLLTDSDPNDGIKQMQETIANIKSDNFLTKPFSQYSNDEKLSLKQTLIGLSHKSLNRLIFTRGHDIEKLINVVMMFSDMITIQEFLLFMEWTPKTTEFYYCLEAVLDYSHTVNYPSWRDPTQLLAQVKVFFEDFDGDINHEFIHRHEPDEDDPEGEIYFHKYPLHLALYRRMPQNVCQYLLSKGANPFLKNDNCLTAFYHAFSHPDPDILDIFLPFLSNPEQKAMLIESDYDPFIHTCQDFASYYNIKILDKLLSLGFDPNAFWRKWCPITILFISSPRRNEDDYIRLHVLKWLIEVGKAEPNAVNSIGQTLLHRICQAPFDNYTHPFVRDYILQQNKFNWLHKDAKEMIPCEYLLDYHLEAYHTETMFCGIFIPNFLCHVILNTGLHHITDQSLPESLKPGDRLKLAKTILFLKYISLANDPTNDGINLMQRIKNQWSMYYKKTVLQQYTPPTLTDSIIVSIVTKEVEKELSDENYLALVKKIIMTDLIRTCGDDNDD